MHATGRATVSVDADQGIDREGRRCGYVYGVGESDGGYWFTWLETTEETVASLDEDAVDSPTFPVEIAADALRKVISTMLPPSPQEDTAP